VKKTILIIAVILCTSQVIAIQGAKYLIIAPDNFIQAVQPLADWKTKKGLMAKVIPISVIGNSAAQIKSYIQNAYNTWELRPEYVLLAGLGTVLPNSGDYDDYFADITGNYLIELSIGRFPCTTPSQCSTIVAKTLSYERTPFLTDSIWFRKGTTVIDEDGTTHPDTVYWNDARYAHTLWRNNNYVYIDSFSRISGHTGTNVIDAINDGRAFVLYRGQTTVNWWAPFTVDPEATSNGFKLPVIVSATCATMDLGMTSYQGDRFLNAGTATNLKGAVGFLGTTVATSGSGLARLRGAVSQGFFRSVFQDGIYKMGDAFKRAKFILDSLRLPNYSTTRYQEWNLYGDPELNLWTATPKLLTVIHDTIIETGSQTYSVLVQQGVNPVSNAMVCVMIDTINYQYGYTNTAGQVSFSLYLPSPGTMSVTVTARNSVPYEKNVIIRPGGIAHDVGIFSLIEPQGFVASGTNVIPKVMVKNFGSHTDTFPVFFKIGNVYNQSVSNIILGADDTFTINFPAWSAVIGSYSIITYTALASDQWRGNDTARSTINVLLSNDVGIDSIFYPGVAHAINQQITPQVRVRNFGALQQENFPVICSIFGSNGILRYTDNRTISLRPGYDVIVTFSTWIPTIAEICNVKMITANPGDMNPANDSKTGITTISNTAQIIIGSATTITSYSPICRTRNYSTNELIYLQSEINNLGTITNLAYYKGRGTNVVPFENVRIYMKHTTDSTLANGTYSLDGYTEVFNGIFTNNDTSGWMNVSLTTQFNYNNIDNLQILVLKGYQQSLQYGYPEWQYTSTSPYNRCRESRGNMQQPTNLSANIARPNMRLTMTIQPPIACDVGIMSIIRPTNFHQPNTVIIPQAKIKNYGTITQNNFPVTCSIAGTNGALRYFDAINIPSLSAGDTLRVNFQSWTPTITELCTIKMRTALIQDSNPLNNRKIKLTNINNTGQVIIGTGTSNSVLGPMNRYSNYSSHEAIYLQSEINTVGNIVDIAYYKDIGSDLNPITNVVIYMKHTADSVLTNGEYSLAGYTEVYNGSFTNNANSGWMAIILNNDFNYNNVDNLQILILKGYQQYLQSYIQCPNWCYTSTAPEYRCRQASDDQIQPISLTHTSARPNIMLTIQHASVDVGVRNIICPLSLHRVNSIIRPSVSIKNYGTLTQYNIPVVCSIIGTYNITRYVDTLSIASLMPNETISAVFRNWSPAISENCVIKIRTNLINDEIPSNDQKTKQTKLNITYLSESFSDTTFSLSAWTKYNFDGGSNYWSIYNGTTHTPPWVAVCQNDTGSIINNDWMITPRIGPVGINDSLTFYYRTQSNSYYETLLVRLSTNANIYDTVQYTVLSLISANSTTYLRKAIDISSYNGNMVYIAFQYRCNQLRIYVDDVTAKGYDLPGITSDEPDKIPFTTMLYSPKPNPVNNRSTRISFSLAEPSRVFLKIFDASGREIKTLVDEMLSSGVYNKVWNGKDERAQQVSEGIYFYTLETSKQKFTKKVVVLN